VVALPLDGFVDMEQKAFKRIGARGASRNRIS
jgi:hypothetical protein